jgi:hypothetical protein
MLAQSTLNLSGSHNLQKLLHAHSINIVLQSVVKTLRRACIGARSFSIRLRLAGFGRPKRHLNVGLSFAIKTLSA